MLVTIDAKDIYFKELNQQIRDVLKTGVEEIILNNVNGQRYIGRSEERRVG